MSLDKADLILIRPYNADDRNFILATFLRGLYYGGFFYSEMEKSTFMKNYHPIAEKLITISKITVACDKTAPDVIYSYIMINPSETAVHFTFTKAAWRKIGLAKSLVPLSIETVSHLTKQGLSILRKYPTLKFDPFTLV